jgi:TonB family protein
MFVPLVLLGSGVGIGQQLSSPVPVSTTDAAAQATEADGPGPTLVAPQPLPLKRPLQPIDKCRENHSGVVNLSLLVDVNGMPEHVSATNSAGTTVEQLAVQVVEEESFKPATLNGRAVASSLSLVVSIDGCLITKTDTAGGTTEVLRLIADPEQTLGKFSLPKQTQTPVSTDDSGLTHAGLARVGNGVSAPVALNHVLAEYSEEARRSGFSGICIVQMIVDAQGKPQHPRVVRALGAGLDEKAIEAVKKYRFKPAMKAGVPVPVMIDVEVNFRLGPI